MTGKQCHRTASIIIERFSEPFLLCSECATHDYLRTTKKNGGHNDRIPRPHNHGAIRQSPEGD